MLSIQEQYKEHKQVRKMPALIVPLAQEKMITTFGIEMRELRRRGGGEAAKKKAKPGMVSVN